MEKLLNALRKKMSATLFAAFVPLADSTNVPIINDLYGASGGLAGFIKTLFTVAISIGAIAAVLRLAYAGYLYMVSDMWTSKEHAREVIRNTFLGLLLLLSIWLILNQINPDILSLKIITG
jgi:hypothetical protein